MTGRQLRIGDDDRDNLVACLAEHYSEGRLTLEEFEARMAAALTSVTRGDLEVLTVDLAAPLPDRRLGERVAAVAGAAVLATVLLVWGVAQEQGPPASEVVCGPHVDVSCYWPAGVEPVDY